MDGEAGDGLCFETEVAEVVDGDRGSGGPVGLGAHVGAGRAELPVPEGHGGEGAIHGRRGPHGLPVDFIGLVFVRDDPALPPDAEADASVAESLLDPGLEARCGVMATGTAEGAHPGFFAGLGPQSRLVEEHAAQLDLVDGQGIVGVLGDGSVFLRVGHPELLVPLFAHGVHDRREQLEVLRNGFGVHRIAWIAGRKGKQHDQETGHGAEGAMGNMDRHGRSDEVLRESSWSSRLSG